MSTVRPERRKLTQPWWEQVLRGDQKGLLAKSIRRVARLGSLGYGAGVKGRDLAYRKGWFAVKRLPQPTICVGNITAGGTGKTPLVIRLASDLMARGLRPAVLLRGYRREKKQRAPLLVRDADTLRATVAEAGDEAMELARRLPGACVGVGPDRYAVGSFLLERHAIDCFILDDGFQHHRLERDINIVTLDVTDPWGGGALLPAGLLREPPEALRRADAVVLTRTSSVGPDRLSVLRAEVAAWMRPSSALLESRHEPESLLPLHGGLPLALKALRGRKILVASAIGNPRAFEQSLAHLEAKIVGALRLTDHSNDAAKVREWIATNRRSAEWVVLTEKDAIRWRTGTFARSASLEYFALRMNFAISAGQDHWDRLIDLIVRLAHARTRGDGLQ